MLEIDALAVPSKEKELLSFSLYHYDVLDSTSEHLKRLARDGAKEGTVVSSFAQTKGHGRYGREWFSPKGNLYFSLLLKPEADVRILSQLSFVVSLAVGRALLSLVEDKETIQYKWPNDILISGKKVSGILLESSLAVAGATADWLIIGVGINMLHAPENMPCLATSLAAEKADEVTEKRLQAAILQQFSLLYKQWNASGFADIRKEWLARAAFLHQDIAVRTATEEYKGLFKDLNSKGEIALEMPDGKMRLVSAGELFFTCDHKRI